MPIDDNHTKHYNYNCWPQKGDEARWDGIPTEHMGLFEDDGRTIIADNVVKQDMLGWVGQGPISDRTIEHLVTSDKGVALYHKCCSSRWRRPSAGTTRWGACAIARGTSRTSRSS